MTIFDTLNNHCLRLELARRDVFCAVLREDAQRWREGAATRERALADEHRKLVLAQGVALYYRDTLGTVRRYS